MTVADPLTKKMDPRVLLEMLSTNQWDTKQPLESLQKKLARQAQRRKMHDFEDDTVHVYFPEFEH